MNLVFFTPTLKSSAIARMCRLLTHQLVAAGHVVTVVQTESEALLGNDTYDFGAPLIPWTKTFKVMGVSKTADALIYHVGNNYLFHQGAMEWLFKLPGIVCLHDYYIGDLFFTWGRSHRRQADLALRTWCNDNKVVKQYFLCSSSEELIDLTRNAAPMTEWVCALAKGVMTHSSWGCTRILGACPGPVRVVPLAYDAPGGLSMAQKTSTNQARKFKVLTIGHINLNKRVASVIQALSQSSVLRSCTSYRLVGAIQPETKKHLSTLAKQQDIELIISGEVDGATLSQAIEESDVVCCLRWPSLEAASASAIESMLYGKPTVVIDTGFYKEIPDDCVRKIDPENEIKDLQLALAFLFQNPEQRKALGIRAQNWAKITFTAENYARALIEMVEAVLKVQPTSDAIDYFTQILRGWSKDDALWSDEHLTSPLKIFEDPCS